MTRYTEGYFFPDTVYIHKHKYMKYLFYFSVLQALNLKHNHKTNNIKTLLLRLDIVFFRLLWQ